MKNPFRFGKEVSGYQFYDRVEISEQLQRKLQSGTANVVLFAPRRYGKTSLVGKVLETLSRVHGINGLCFDLTKTPSLESFCQEYVNAVYAGFGGGRELLHRVVEFLSDCNVTVAFGMGGVAELKFEVGRALSARSISEVLDLPEKLSRELGNRPFVVAFDEFQEVAEISRDFPLEKIFRSCIQSHRNVRYVFLGSKAHLMKRMFGDASKPFYNSAYVLPLGKPPEAESVEFLVSRFRDAGQGIPSELAERIMRVSDNIPYYLQEMASEVFDSVEMSGRTEVKAEDIEIAAESITSKSAELYEVRMSGLSAAKRAIVRALAREPVRQFDEDYRARHSLPVSSTIHTAMKELVESGVIDNAGGLYHHVDPFFVRYLQSSPVRVFGE